MTDSEILKTIESIRPNIKRLAVVFRRKMRQPSIHSLGDLEQEAVESIVYHLRKGNFNPDKKATLETYLILSVLSKYTTLMHKSFKQNPIEEKKNEFYQFAISLENTKVGTKMEDVDFLIYLFDVLTKREKEYISFMVNPPEQLRNRISKNRRIVRKVVRENLGMSEQEEKKVREGIKKKLEKIR